MNEFDTGRSGRVRGYGRRPGYAGSIGAFLLPTMVFAQTGIPVTDLSGETPVELGAIVLTASGFEQSIADAPASISVVPGEALRTNASTT